MSAVRPSRRHRGAAPIGIVGEAELAHLVRLVDVAAVEDHRLLHQRLHALEVRPAELVPLGDEQQRVGALERVVVAAVID